MSKCWRQSQGRPVGEKKKRKRNIILSKTGLIVWQNRSHMQLCASSCKFGQNTQENREIDSHSTESTFFFKLIFSPSWSVCSSKIRAGKSSNEWGIRLFQCGRTFSTSSWQSWNIRPESSKILKFISRGNNLYQKNKYKFLYCNCKFQTYYLMDLSN